MQCHQKRIIDKISCTIYANIEYLIKKKKKKKKIDAWANNPENFSKTEIGEHIPCGYSMSTMLAFNNTENKHILYLGNNCMKKFCESLRKFLLKGKKCYH